MSEQIVVLTKDEIKQMIREAVQESLPAPEPAEAWDVDDVANFLKVSPQKVRDLAAFEGLAHRRVGKLIRFSPREVTEWLAGRRRGE